MATLEVITSATGITDAERLQNTATAANNNGAKVMVAANRTTSGLTDVASIAGIITDVTQSAYKGAVTVSTADNAAPAERVRIDHAGRVGIGVSNPQYTLDVTQAQSGATARFRTNAFISEFDGGATISGGGYIDSSGSWHSTGLGGYASAGFSTSYYGRGVVAFEGSNSDEDDSQITFALFFPDGRFGIGTHIEPDLSAGSSIAGLANGNVGVGTTSPAYRLSVGGLENGQQFGVDSVETLLSGLSGATATASNLIPAGSVMFGATVRVTTAITGATSFDIGDGTDVDRWGAGIATSVNTTTNGSAFTIVAVPIYAAATSIVLTANGGSFTGGAVRVTVHYMRFTPAGA